MSQGQPPGGQWTLPKRYLEVPGSDAEGDQNQSPQGRAASPKRVCTPENIGLGPQDEVWGTTDNQGGGSGSLWSTVDFQSVVTSDTNVWNDWRPSEDNIFKLPQPNDISVGDAWQLPAPTCGQSLETFNHNNFGSDWQLPSQQFPSYGNDMTNLTSYQNSWLDFDTASWLPDVDQSDISQNSGFNGTVSLPSLDSIPPQAQNLAWNFDSISQGPVAEFEGWNPLESTFEPADQTCLTPDHEDGVQISSQNDIDSASVEDSPTQSPEDITSNMTYGESTHEESIETGFDTCFGMIVVDGADIEEDVRKTKGPIDVKLQISDSMTTVRNASSDSYCGLVDKKTAKVFADLIKKYHVKLASTIESSKGLSVLIYGNEEDGNTIGSFLLESDCFLQHPETLDSSTVYRNPQMLIRPGSDFVSSGLADLTSVPMPQRVLNTEDKSKIAELLDSASGPTTFKWIQPSSILQTELKTHQLKALSMMTEKESGVLQDQEFPAIWTEIPPSNSSSQIYRNNITGTTAFRRPKLCLGGLLADDMGLGKTLTMLALIAGSLHHQKKVGQSTLVITPLSTITNWEDQIQRHFKNGSIKCLTYHGPGRRKFDNSISLYDIVLTTYETLRTEILPGSSQQASCLGATAWLRVVLDEAHIIRNRKSKLFSATNQLKATHRWCITGTPIQNTLEDLGGIIGFLRAYPFDDARYFKSMLINPTYQSDATNWAHFRRLIQAVALRRTKSILNDEIMLPLKTQVIVPIRLDTEERQIYDIVKRRLASSMDSKESFRLVLRLRQICNHGSDLLPQELRNWLEEVAVYSNSPMPDVYVCEACNTVPTNSTVSTELLSCAHQLCLDCVQFEEIETGDNRKICPICECTTGGGGYMSTAVHQPLESTYKPSSKVKALLNVLEGEIELPAAASGHRIKSVVFSMWTGMLDLVGEALSLRRIPYERLDGSKSLSQRRQVIRNFHDSPDYTILLATIGSAGVGLDLTVASRVHILEPDWNPMLQHQAIDRVHRLGQAHEVVCTQYVVSGNDSIEEHILTVQNWKTRLAVSSFAANQDGPQEPFKGLVKNFQSLIKQTRPHELNPAF